MNQLLFLVAFGFLGYILKYMATEKQLNDAITKLETDLTSEIDQIKAELAKTPGVPDSAVQRLTDLSAKISGIIEEAQLPTA